MSNRIIQQQKHEAMLQRIRDFWLMDDDFMTKCFEENIKGRSLRLDIYAMDSTGKKYNIEIQRADKGAGAKRARYNSSLIDSDILPAGFEVENLAETFVIFITENDVIGKNKPIYHIDRYIREAEEYFNDGSHIIYVNASYKDDTDLGKLMHDFSVTNPGDMNFKVLAATARYYKEDKEGIQAMCKIMEDMITDEKKNAAIRMLERGKLTKEEISEDLDLPLSVVDGLADELQQS